MPTQPQQRLAVLDDGNRIAPAVDVVSAKEESELAVFLDCVKESGRRIRR
jgi:hypothetical protein